MAEDKISSYIDRVAFASDTKFAKEELAQLEGLYTKLRDTRVNLSNATGTSAIVNNAKQASTVLQQLKVKNAELTNTIKEQQIAIRAAAEERKKAAAEERAAIKQAKLDKQQQIEQEKEAAKQAQIAGQEKLRALREQAEAEKELEAVEKQRQSIGSYDIAQGSGQTGGAKLKSTTQATEQVYAPSNQQEALLLNLTQTEALLKENRAAQKSLEEQLASGTITQAKYDEQLVIAKQEELAYKASIQATNKELKARQTLNDSAAGTIKAAQAQNILLRQQVISIPVGEGATPEQIEKVKQLNAEIDKNNELIDKNTDLLGRQKINIGNYPTALGQTFKTLNEELTSVQGKLVQGNFGGKEFDQLTAKQTVLQNALSLTGKTFKTSAAEATAYKEAAIQIGQVYGKDSTVFKEFAAGVKQGAANTKALASEVAGVATKGKGFLSFFSSAYGVIRKLAYAIPGLGIGGLILLLLGPLQAAGAALVKWSNNATKAGRDFQDLQTHVKNLNSVIEKSGSAYENATAQVSKLTEDVKLAKEGLISKNEVLKEYNDTMGKTTGKLTDFDQVEKKIVDHGAAFIHLMFLKAEATNAYALAAEAARKVLTAQQDAEKDFGVGSQFLASTKSFFQNLGSSLFGGALDGKYLASAGKNAATQINKNAEEIKKEQQKAFEDLRKQGDKFEQEAAQYAKDNGLAFDPATDKKGRQESESLADQYRKKALQAQQEFIKAQNEAELKGYKTIADDQQASLQDRLKAEDNYYKKSKAITLQSVQDQIDAVNLEADLAEKRTSSIKDPKKRADAQAAIEQYRTNAIKKIHELGNAELLKNDEDYYSATVNISTQAFDKIRKEADEAYKFLAQQQKEAYQNQKDQIDTSRYEKLIALEKSVQNGSIANTEEYNQKKLEINQAADKEQEELELKHLKQLEAFEEAYYMVTNPALIKQMKELEAKIIAEGNDKILEKEKDLQDAKRQLLSEGLKTLQTFVDAGFEERKNQIEKEITIADAQAQHQIDLVNASTLTEQQKADKIKIINERAAAQKEQLQKQEAEQDQKKARFDRAFAMAQVVENVAIAVTSHLKKPYLIPFDIAIGAAEIAAILAQPLPQYKMGKGENDNYEGLAVVGDGGKSEYIVRTDGSIQKTPATDTLTYVGKDDLIFKDHTEMLKAFAMPALKQVPSNPVNNEVLYSEIKKQTPLLNKIANKRELHIGASHQGMAAIWQWGASQTKYISENTNW
jgi:hypothetical protein